MLDRLAPLPLVVLALALAALGCSKPREEAPRGRRSPEAAPTPPALDQPILPETRLLNQEAAGLHIAHRGASLGKAVRVVVLFHGYGADEEDLLDLAHVMDTGPRTAFVSPRAPIELPSGGYAWFARDGSDFERGYRRAKAFVQWVSRESPQARLIVGGFSQGAMLTANLVVDLPERAEAALVFSPADYLPHPPKPSTRKIPIFVSHGSDDRVLPFEGGQKIHDRFQSAGFDVTWQPFDGPHTIGRDVLVGLNSFLGALPSK